MTSPRFAVRIDRDETVPIDLRSETRQALREEAALRRMSPAALASELLDAIAKGDQFALVLRGGQRA